MELYTYVNFAGTCREAFKYCEKHLGGKIGMLMFRHQLDDRAAASAVVGVRVR
jgi:uncharacterized glyoxalase superfamily protein PhnB